MGYRTAMEAAGATVLAYESFGSYQGDWFALVVYGGKTFWVHGSYGSCSGCDAFCAEFDFGVMTTAAKHIAMTSMAIVKIVQTVHRTISVGLRTLVGHTSQVGR